MNSPVKRLAPTFALAALVFAGAARADIHCAVPMVDWQPREAVMQLAAKNGWTVLRVRIDDGCYEVKGTDAAGHKFKVKLHPGTLAVVTQPQDNDDKHQDNEQN